MPPRSTAKPSARNPLADISNGGRECPSRSTRKIAGVKADDKTSGIFRDRNPPCSVYAIAGGDAGSSNAAVDLLVSTRSDLAGLVQEIDKLLAHAIDRKTVNQKDIQLIISLGSVLEDVHLSLKTWFTGFQKSFLDAGYISTQPATQFVSRLVHDLSERADPKLPSKNLPKPSTTPVKCKPKSCLSKNLIDRSHQKNSVCLVPSISNTPFMKGQILVDPAINSIDLESKCLSKETHMENDMKDMNGMFPLPKLPNVSKSVPEDLSGREKMILPCANALESHTKLAKSKSESWISSKTPFLQDLPAIDPVNTKGESISIASAAHNDLESSADDIVEEVFDGLASKCGAIFDTQPTDKFVHKREVDATLEWFLSPPKTCIQPNDKFVHKREVDTTLEWFLSPPKTCILLEPSDNKRLEMKHLLPTPGKGTAVCAPVWSGIQGTVRKVEHCGESTLKKELWTRFDALPSTAQFGTSVFRKSGRKGFLDLLEEASKEPNDFELQQL